MKALKVILSLVFTLIFFVGTVSAAPARVMDSGNDLSEIDYFYEIGDVNMDTDITSVDALYVLKHAVGSEVLSAKQLTLADVNHDTNVNALDGLMILQYTVKIITAF